MRTIAGVLMVFVAAMAVSAQAAAAGPVPRPPAHKQAGDARDRTVVRCQSDDTDQIEDFGDDDEPRHGSTPIESGRCSRDALGIARVLAGEHPRRAARTVRARSPRRVMSRTRPPLRLVGERRPGAAAARYEEPRP